MEDRDKTSSTVGDREGGDGFPCVVGDDSESAMRSVKGVECVPAEGLTHSPADRDGLDSHSVVPVFTRKRIPTKVAAKVEPGENEKLAIRLEESASSGLSEFRRFPVLAGSEGLAHKKSELCSHQISHWRECPWCDD